MCANSKIRCGLQCDTIFQLCDNSHARARESRKSCVFLFSCFSLLFCLVMVWRCRRRNDGVKAIQWIKSISIWMAAAVAHPLIISPKCQCRHFQSHLTFCSATATNTKISFPSFSSFVGIVAAQPLVLRRRSVQILFPSLLFGAGAAGAYAIAICSRRCRRRRQRSCWLVLSFYLCASLFQRK